MTTDSILAPLATIHAPDAGQLNTRAHAALTMVESMVIDSQETYDLAADELKAIKSKSTTLETQRTAITGPINKALKAVNDLFRGPAQYLDQDQDAHLLSRAGAHRRRRTPQGRGAGAC